MKYFILCLFILSTTHVYAEDQFLEFGTKSYEKRKSHFLVELGGAYLQTELKAPVYQGSHYKIRKKEDIRLVGPELALGINIHLFSGLFLDLKARGYMLSDLKGEVGKASKDFNEDLAKVNTDSKLNGLEASGSLSYLFETKIINFAPFFEFALGRSEGTQNFKYKFDGISGTPAEYYKMDSTSLYTTARASLGVNFISNRGIFSYFKLSQEMLTLNEYKMKYTFLDKSGTQTSGGEKEKNLSKTQSLTTYALGFGFLF